MEAMTKAANPKPSTRRRKAKSPAVQSAPERKTRRLSPAQKILRSVGGWAGDDLEEVMAIVAATRTRSRF
jgi:hypothetical protein